MLMSAEVAVPRQIFGHGFMTVDGQRMSKTLGNARSIRSTRPIGWGRTDPLRLYLVKEVSFGGDGDFSLGALRRAVQRRPREQPREPRQPRVGDGRTLPATAG